MKCRNLFSGKDKNKNNSKCCPLKKNPLFCTGAIFSLLFTLTLKTPRKTASENVVCLCRLLNILANFFNLFMHTGKQCGP